MTITSVSNNNIRYIRTLVSDRKLRQSEGVIVLEGENLISALPKGVVVEQILVQEGKQEKYADLIAALGGEYLLVSDNVMRAVSSVNTPSGIVAAVKYTVPKAEGGRAAVIADGITDPGNMGTIIRSAAACGIKDIIAIECCDITSPKVIRATMGGIFSVNVSEITRDYIASICNGYRVFALDMRGENIYNINKEELSVPYALAVGSEAHGISKALKDKAYKIVSLPMTGTTESLNAAISLSVGLYQFIFGNKA